MIYVSTTCFPDGADVITCIDQLKRVGVEHIELGSTHSYSQLDHKEFLARRVQYITHNHFPPSKNNLVINLASPNEEERQLSLSFAEQAIDFAASIGADKYTVHPGFPGTAALRQPSPSGDRNFDFAVAYSRDSFSHLVNVAYDALIHLGRYGYEKGVTVCVENQGSRFADRIFFAYPEMWHELITSAQGRLKLNFNLAHWQLFSKVAGLDEWQGIQSYVLEHIGLVELSHHDGTFDQHLPVTNATNIERWLKLFSEQRRPIVAEYRGVSIDCVLDSLAYLSGVYET